MIENLDSVSRLSRRLGADGYSVDGGRADLANPACQGWTRISIAGEFVTEDEKVVIFDRTQPPLLAG